MRSVATTPIKEISFNHFQFDFQLGFLKGCSINSHEALAEYFMSDF